jgi:hypothetical protein
MDRESRLFIVKLRHFSFRSSRVDAWELGEKILMKQISHQINSNHELYLPGPESEMLLDMKIIFISSKQFPE